MLRTFLVEDEPLSRLYLSHMLSTHFPQVEVAGHATTEAEALAGIESLQPDLVFLDIELQMGTGFGVIEKMAAGQAQIIFTTALDQAAGRLLSMSGVPYLQKPIDVEALALVLAQIQDKDAATKSALSLCHLRQSLAHNYEAQTICLSCAEMEYHVPLQDIVRAESIGEASSKVFLVSGKTHTTAIPLRTLESLLTPAAFYRTHPDHLINTVYVALFPEIKSAMVEMQDGSRVPLSPRKTDGLRALLGR